MQLFTEPRSPIKPNHHRLLSTFSHLNTHTHLVSYPSHDIATLHMTVTIVTITPAPSHRQRFHRNTPHHTSLSFTLNQQQVVYALDVCQTQTEMCCIVTYTHPYVHIYIHIHTYYIYLHGDCFCPLVGVLICVINF